MEGINVMKDRLIRRVYYPATSPKLLVIAVWVLSLAGSAVASSLYEPNWASIDRRPIPAWFNEAKFGIFVVWGPYSVPAWKDGGYAEWYGFRMNQTGSSTEKFHRQVYGEDFRYEDFVPMFKAELFDPNAWCDLFVQSGAKYVVTTSNYHDGFAMWPTTYGQFNETDHWNSLERGPKRDIIGQLNAAGQERGLKMGIYYSLYEWYHPLYKDPNTRDRFVAEHLHPKFKEVVTKYKPWFIFLDGDWEGSDKTWRSEELAAWLYNESPCRDYVVTNDRWGKNTRGEHGDSYESEYGGGLWCSTHHTWQEDRGIGQSYGFNRWETIDHYDSSKALIRMLSHVAGGGGNYLLCVGPTADGRIPVIMQERLRDIGQWLKINGQAIYDTTASPFWPRRFKWGTITARPGKLYLHVHDATLDSLELAGLQSRVDAARLLTPSGPEKVAIEKTDDGVQLNWQSHWNASSVTIIELDVEDPVQVDRTPRQAEDGIISMNVWAMKVHGLKARPLYYGFEDRLRMVDWTDPNEYVTAKFYAAQPGRYKLAVDMTVGKDQAGGRFEIELSGQKVETTLESTTGFKSVDIGTMTIEKAGLHTLTIRPVIENAWKGMGLRSLTLTPIPGHNKR